MAMLGHMKLNEYFNEHLIIMNIKILGKICSQFHSQHFILFSLQLLFDLHSFNIVAGDELS